MRTAVSILILFLCTANPPLWAQDIENVYLDTMDVSVNELHARYQPSQKRTIDMLHLHLEVRPDFKNKQLDGIAQLTARPYNRPIDNIVLDAKGMLIHNVMLVLEDGSEPLTWQYDDWQLEIPLPGRYHAADSFTVQVNYTARPYELEENGLVLTSGRGVYFIDPMDHNPVKPVQMWSQGETISNSAWFPVVDAPNDALTHDILITVNATYETLSNGILTETELHGDGTKTDRWEMRQPHGPHLAMIAAGEFSVVREYVPGPDSIELAYYTTEAYAGDAAALFCATADMFPFFDSLFQEPYPWDRYAQMVVYDYTSGAMENTTAVIFFDGYYADRTDMLDINYEDIIAHELSHHWFGNLVACESWAHLTLNESLATYAEILWFDHRFGRDEADKMNRDYLKAYLNEFVYKSEPIVNYYYDDPEELFDRHRYDKGSCVLHMLRNYLGDDFFFDGLAKYLDDFRFGSAEIHDLRLAMEAVSGEDLNWFFDQWFMKPGHPVVDIRQEWDKQRGLVEIEIRQRQDIGRYGTFRFPLAIDIYLRDTVVRHEAWVDQRRERILIDVPNKPFLVNVDADKVMLWDKEEDKTRDEWIHQYRNAPLYVDRSEAVSKLRFRQTDARVREVYLAALEDPFWHIRQSALENMDLELYHAPEMSAEKVFDIAMSDPYPIVRKAALIALDDLGAESAMRAADSLFHNDSSRLVRAEALGMLYGEAPGEYYLAAMQLDRVDNIHLKYMISRIYSERGDASRNDFFLWALWSSRPYYCGYLMERYVAFLERMDVETLKNSAAFLAGLATHEESSFLRNLAENALYDLSEFYRRSTMDDREEKEGVLRRALEALAD